MKIPPGYTESQVLDIIDNITTRLANKFKFGYHGTEDMKQEGTVFALEVLEKGKYDGSNPLESFLWTCVHNLLFNLKRNKYERPDKPCLECPFYDKHCAVSSSQCDKFSDKMDCALFSGWLIRNSAKKNLMRPMDIGIVIDEKERTMKTNDNTEDVEKEELWGLIDQHLAIDLREDYLKMRADIRVSNTRKAEIQEAIIAITDKYYTRLEVE